LKKISHKKGLRKRPWNLREPQKEFSLEAEVVQSSSAKESEWKRVFDVIFRGLPSWSQLTGRRSLRSFSGQTVQFTGKVSGWNLRVIMDAARIFTSANQTKSHATGGASYVLSASLQERIGCCQEKVENQKGRDASARQKSSLLSRDAPLEGEQRVFLCSPERKKNFGLTSMKIVREGQA